MSQKTLIKDKLKRNQFFFLEKKKILLKNMLNNMSFDPKFRNIIYKKYKNLCIITSITKIHNRCIFTNRSKAVYKKFKLSRIFFKEYALESTLMGIRKASW